MRALLSKHTKIKMFQKGNLADKVLETEEPNISLPLLHPLHPNP